MIMPAPRPIMAPLNITADLREPLFIMYRSVAAHQPNIENTTGTKTASTKPVISFSVLPIGQNLSFFFEYPPVFPRCIHDLGIYYFTRMHRPRLRSNARTVHRNLRHAAENRVYNAEKQSSPESSPETVDIKTVYQPRQRVKHSAVNKQSE